MKIFLDMDGVLANFDSKFDSLFGVRPKEGESRRRHFWDNWNSFIHGRRFEELEMMPDALLLIESVKQFGVPVEILSSSGGKEHHEAVREQKIKWLKKHNIDFHPNIVPGGAKKAAYASEWNILVDDTKDVVENYRAKGGTAILHTNAVDTLAVLNGYHTVWMERNKG